MGILSRRLMVSEVFSNLCDSVIPRSHRGSSSERQIHHGRDSHVHFRFGFLQVRKVSNEIAHTANENITADRQLSLVFMHWGQWVNHDIDLAPATGEGASLELQCHTSCAFKPPCFPIKVP